MSPKSDPLADLIIPPNLIKLQTQAGAHRKGMKILAWGEAKGGKSYFAAHLPYPKVVITAGDNGIEQYLDESLGVKAFDVTNPGDLVSAINFALANEGTFKSLVIDPLTLAWEDWMDAFNDKFGGDIKGGQWKEVKAPWKLLVRKLMRSSLHICFTAWVDDIVYEQKEVAPGVKGGLQIFSQEKPKVEKRIPHTLDMALNFSIGRDSMRRETCKRIARLTMGRRPMSVPPADFHTGKEWVFDEREAQDPWKVIVEPILEKWQEGAVDHLGVDPEAAAADLRDLEITAQEQNVGQILTLINKQTDLAKYKLVWSRQIEDSVKQLDKEHTALVIKAHEEKKAELTAKGKKK